MNLRASDLSVDAAVACVEAVAETQDRRVASAVKRSRVRGQGWPINPDTGKQLRGFAIMDPWKAESARRKAGATKGPYRTSPMVRFGLDAEEFRTWGVIRAKGFSAEEAAEIVIRSRRPTKAEG